MLTHGDDDDDDDDAWYVVYKYAWYCYRRPRARTSRLRPCNRFCFLQFLFSSLFFSLFFLFFSPVFSSSFVLTPQSCAPNPDLE